MHETENDFIETDRMEIVMKRWIRILQGKSIEFEHSAREEGKEVTVPCLDDICNEMNAFMHGYIVGKHIKEK